ncbi:hypothetical protein [Herbaspirillum sp. RV1423]|uniref:hypothetical protein n=1 Tax=Herbaspirillum sp. RV1423 TaxID=1443993 RepID=UPI0004BC6D7D|nr:hypothetical protein [Herbaspirillum sp. RV1423]
MLIDALNTTMQMFLSMRDMISTLSVVQREINSWKPVGLAADLAARLAFLQCVPENSIALYACRRTLKRYLPKPVQ